MATIATAATRLLLGCTISWKKMQAYQMVLIVCAGTSTHIRVHVDEVQGEDGEEEHGPASVFTRRVVLLGGRFNAANISCSRVAV